MQNMLILGEDSGRSIDEWREEIGKSEYKQVQVENKTSNITSKKLSMDLRANCSISVRSSICSNLNKQYFQGVKTFV